MHERRGEPWTRGPPEKAPKAEHEKSRENRTNGARRESKAEGLATPRRADRRTLTSGANRALAGLGSVYEWGWGFRKEVLALVDEVVGSTATS